MKTKIYKYCLYIMATMTTNGLLAQSANDPRVAFKEIQNNWAADNFTIREIKKKELQIDPSKIVSLNMTPVIPAKEKHLKKKKRQ